MFGTLEGVITSLNDSNMVTVKKPVMTAILCGSACIIGLIFTTGSGQVIFSIKKVDLLKLKKDAKRIAILGTTLTILNI